MGTMTLSGPVISTDDIEELTRFYSELLGWEVTEREGPQPGDPAGGGWTRIQSPDGQSEIEIQFEEHFEPPTWPLVPGGHSMQVHFDIRVDNVPRGVAWAQACGAREADFQPPNRDPERLRIMLDPSGHPFCLWG